MGMSQPADLTTNPLFTSDGIVVLHYHVEIGTDEPQWRAIEIEQRVEVRTLANCELHERGPIVFEQFVNLGDYPGLARRCYRIHDEIPFYAVAGITTALPRNFPFLRSLYPSLTRLSGYRSSIDSIRPSRASSMTSRRLTVPPFMLVAS